MSYIRKQNIPEKMQIRRKKTNGSKIRIVGQIDGLRDMRPIKEEIRKSANRLSRLTGERVGYQVICLRNPANLA